MTVSQVQGEFLGAGCNRGANLSVLTNDGILAFAVRNTIALARVLDNYNFTIYKTLVVDELMADVTSIDLIIDPLNEDKSCGLMAGFSNGSTVIWKRIGDKWEFSHSVQDHSSSVSLVKSLKINDGFVFVTGSDDCACHLYKINADFSMLQKMDQSIRFGGRKFATSIGISHLPTQSDSLILLALACTDCKIYFYWARADAGEFHQSLVLPGHENWIRDMNFMKVMSNNGNDWSLLMSSASQDSYIRVWKICPISEAELMEESNPDPIQAFSKLQKSTQSKTMHIEGSNFRIAVDSVVYGHTNWVYSAKWWSDPENSSLRMISASADKCILLWEYDGSSNTWLCTARLGEVGGNSLGFFGAHFSRDGNAVIAQGYNGSFYVWKNRQLISDDNVLDENEFNWISVPSVTGHGKEVRGCAWAYLNNGEAETSKYLVTVSADQTTRIWSTWKRDDRTTWHEIARPQIHGYDMQSIAPLSFGDFISGAEEKVLRVFSAPKMFLRSYGCLQDWSQEQIEALERTSTVMGANVPALGLSNKAVSSIEDSKQIVSADPFADNRFQTHYRELEETGWSSMRRAPLETDLVSSTLWPEVEKMYGHGYEIYAVAASPDGTLIASSCKSSTMEHAAIRIWSRETLKTIATLPGHQLTVTKLLFSPCNRFLLSVSRDRQWILHERIGTEEWRTAASMKGAHSRIIWSCCWSPDSRFFVTCSRDKKVKLWRLVFDGSRLVDLASQLELESAVNSVSANPVQAENGDLQFCVGLENGRIHIISATGAADEQLSLCRTVDFPPEQCHADSVTDLDWSLDGMIASVGSDNYVRISKIKQ